MIHFDTNALIALPLWAREGHAAVQRVLDGEPAAVCAVVWYEFLVVPIDADTARMASTLFNGAGRRRTLKTDALIAAAAIQASAEFFTLNVDDFRAFVDGGLRLASP